MQTNTTVNCVFYKFSLVFLLKDIHLILFTLKLEIINQN